MSPAMNGAKLVKGFVNMVMGMQAYQEWNNSECSWENMEPNARKII